MKNLRARGTVQVFPWLSIENNADYSTMNYHNPIKRRRRRRYLEKHCG
jgi:hypothetical protein